TMPFLAFLPIAWVPSEATHSSALGIARCVNHGAHPEGSLLVWKIYWEIGKPCRSLGCFVSRWSGVSAGWGDWETRGPHGYLSPPPGLCLIGPVLRPVAITRRPQLGNFRTGVPYCVMRNQSWTGLQPAISFAVVHYEFCLILHSYMQVPRSPVR